MSVRIDTAGNNQTGSRVNHATLTANKKLTPALQYGTFACCKVKIGADGSDLAILQQNVGHKMPRDR